MDLFTAIEEADLLKPMSRSVKSLSVLTGALLYRHAIIRLNHTHQTRKMISKQLRQKGI